MSYNNLLLAFDENIAVLTINRPDKLNALNDDTLDEIKQAVTDLNKNDTCRVIIITGAGQKAFVAGADIKELNKLDKKTGEAFAKKGQDVFNTVEKSQKPVIAAVNGYALGGGCELALACHIRYASENAIFGQPEINLGIIPGYGGTQRLARVINYGRAMEYILSGDNIKADEAYRIGLTNKIFTQEELLEKTKELAKKIAKKSLCITAFAIDSVNATNTMTMQSGFNYEAKLFGDCCSTDDFKEGTSAFLEKRKPDFKDK